MLEVCREKCLPVDIELDYTEITEEMSRIRQENNGVGLAAPQIGYNLCIINVVIRGKEYTIFNPYISNKRGMGIMVEGCLSLPALYVVKRPETLTLRGEDSYGNKIKIKCHNLWESSIAMHEVDHLSGKLIDETGKFYKEKETEEHDKLAWG